MNDTDTVVELEGVWKVFGARAKEALEAAKPESVSKAEILSEYACVVGVRDASFKVAKG